MQNPKQEGKRPYKVLGTHLKYVREQSNETLVEVSGAVEIDAEALERIESGDERPSEDILMLLINHFNVQDQEAVQLWESAGYEGDNNPGRRQVSEVLDKATVVILAMDARPVYSDGLLIDASRSGLVINFTHGDPNKKQQIPISRIGMSYDQAEEVIKSLQHAILYGRHSQGRQLPPGSR